MADPAANHPPHHHVGAAQVALSRTHPARIALYYAVAGLVWVAISDQVLSLMPAHSYTLNRLMFVSVNALLLYLVAIRYMKTIRLSLTSREDALAHARGYFESSVEAIITADARGHIRQVNPRGLEMFGYHELDLVGQPIEMLLPQRFRDRHEGHRRQFFLAPSSRMMGSGMEISGRRNDGSEFPAEVSLNVVDTPRGSLVIAFVTDITERRAMEREARRNETVNALGAVAAGVAHELNNPLAVMGSRLELMLSGDIELAAETRNDLLVLQRNVERASRISHNMLSLARQRPGARNPMDMNVAIEDALLIVAAETRPGETKFETNLDRSIPPVMGQVTGLEQVLINLAMNARDAGARVVRISTAEAPSRPGYIQLTFADDGAGVEPAQLEKLFEPFFTTKPKGTGLGLWLSQRIIRDHGGTIAVESELGKGATFTITLPAIDESAPVEPIDAEQPAANSTYAAASAAPAATSPTTTVRR
ncbi:MAG TPA: ATP-binding protein [Candidatus Acidoferrales bacterium]|nr:ATP-binding protein [Candidatus Acidoferrales bacterium]